MVKDKIVVGGLELGSRIVMPPMATAKSDADGQVTDELCRYYAERAEGGYLGLIITEHCYISQQGKARAGQMSAVSDADIEGMKRLTDAIHRAGVPCFCQLNHAGSAGIPEVTGTGLVSASAVRNPVPNSEQLPRELTVPEIHRIEDQYAEAALRAKQAGYDGVEIHTAHSYLLNQFLSPLTNRRSDDYGGSMENRTRMHVEVIRKVKEKVGETYPIAIRLGGCDYLEGGNTIEDAVRAAEIFEKAGVCMIDISGGMCRYTRPGHTEPGYFADQAAAVKAAVSVPVLVTGGVTTADQAELLLQSGCADLIGVGRAILKDAGWTGRELG